MKTVLLIGLGRFGRHLAMQLNELGHQVMAVDKDEERVNECMPLSPTRRSATAPCGLSALAGREQLRCLLCHHQRKFSEFAGDDVAAQGAGSKICGIPR